MIYGIYRMFGDQTDYDKVSKAPRYLTKKEMADDLGMTVEELDKHFKIK